MATLLIVNPFASGVDEQRLAAVAAALGSPEVVRTSGPGHATALAREALGRVEAIHVFGGDGTFNEVLNGVDATTPLGLVPGGGTSVLPRALGLPRDPVRAAERNAFALGAFSPDLDLFPGAARSAASMAPATCGMEAIPSTVRSTLWS